MKASKLLATGLLALLTALSGSGQARATNLAEEIVWYTNQPLYFTDPGDLSASVNHAAADALVAAAANVWNVSTSSLVLVYGGSLDEHISGANVYPTPSGLVFPSDVESSNYLAKQIAIIYDYDGYEERAVGILLYSSFVYQEMPEEMQADEEDGWARDGDLLAAEIERQRPGVYTFACYGVET